ncbi:alpha/beta-hydrolase [Gigaspora margarita]|uniref:Alpha/beta-hydrolase n=1 Tax=Gigaspora margarita TaxID=4874 RepID=A0A8H3X9S8_GIGMA|nr:alpha/beta-hydrolase [Gigaspora margarita]
MSLPLLFTTLLKHYTEGPPGKSWDLKFHLTVAAMKNDDSIFKLPIEESQKKYGEYVGQVNDPSNIVIKEVILDERYRQKSRTHLEKVLKQYEDVLDEKWKEPSDGSMENGNFTSKYAEYAKARVFSIDYRLSPQNQFPAALCDSIAAYLYLIDPGSDAGFEPINPKKIVFAGESAGGGLTFATLLFLRDAGLPLPGGAFGMSPWVDLTHSMPSFWDAEVDKADFIPKLLGFRKIGPSSPVADVFIANAKALSDKIALKKPTIVGHPSFTEVPRVQLYCANEAMAIPYISPKLAESLGDLPPILCQVGGLERFRDESPFKNPTKVVLEVYDDMIHVWPLLTSSKPSQVAFERFGKFVNCVTSIDGENISINSLKEGIVAPSSSFIAMRIGTKGEIRELNETDRDCLKWDKIGIVPKEEV